MGTEHVSARDKFPYLNTAKLQTRYKTQDTRYKKKIKDTR